MNGSPGRGVVEVQAAHANELALDLRLLLGRLKRRLRDQASIGDLTPSQLAALLQLERLGAATVSGLARAESMRPQSMAPIVAVLQAGGLVDGAPDPSDGRQTLFSLTEECRARIRQGRAARQDWLSRALGARYSPAEQEILARALALLGRLVEEDGPGAVTGSQTQSGGG